MGVCTRKRVVYDISCKRLHFFVNVEALLVSRRAFGSGELTRIVRGSDYSPAIALSEGKNIFRGIPMFEKLMAHNNPDVDLVSDYEYTIFG